MNRSRSVQATAAATVIAASGSVARSGNGSTLVRQNTPATPAATAVDNPSTPSRSLRSHNTTPEKKRLEDSLGTVTCEAETASAHEDEQSDVHFDIRQPPTFSDPPDKLNFVALLPKISEKLATMKKNFEKDPAFFFEAFALFYNNRVSPIRTIGKQWRNEDRCIELNNFVTSYISLLRAKPENTLKSNDELFVERQL